MEILILLVHEFQPSQKSECNFACLKGPDFRNIDNNINIIFVFCFVNFFPGDGFMAQGFVVIFGV